jgi:hypothetical protein
VIRNYQCDMRREKLCILSRDFSPQSEENLKRDSDMIGTSPDKHGNLISQGLGEPFCISALVLRRNPLMNLLSSRLLSRNLKIKIYRPIIMPVVLSGCETWSLPLREERKRKVVENGV